VGSLSANKNIKMHEYAGSILNLINLNLVEYVNNAIQQKMMRPITKKQHLKC